MCERRETDRQGQREGEVKDDSTVFDMSTWVTGSAVYWDKEQWGKSRLE